MGETELGTGADWEKQGNGETEQGRYGKRENRRTGVVNRILSYKELRVYQLAMTAAMEIFELTKSFPQDEKFSLVDQMRRSSRSVCANIAEAWRKRRYKAALIAKLNDAESEACETQVWLEFANRCGYIKHNTRKTIDETYEHIISQLVLILDNADKWLIKSKT